MSSFQRAIDIEHFYPRSPCGERLEVEKLVPLPSLISIHALLAESDLTFMLYETSSLIFLSTLSLRRATTEEVSGDTWQRDFYPRSPCGERLLLVLLICPLRDFYPRSPCGERRQTKQNFRAEISISIHALLAESDCMDSA